MSNDRDTFMALRLRNLARDVRAGIWVGDPSGVARILIGLADEVDPETAFDNSLDRGRALEP